MPTYQTGKKSAAATRTGKAEATTGTDQARASLPSLLGLATGAAAGGTSSLSEEGNANATWFTFDENNQEVGLSATALHDLFSSNQPSIIITGDGHSNPPFQYADRIPGLMKKLGEGNLHFFVEGTDASVLEQRSAYLPDKLASYGFLRKKKTALTGWEDPVMQSGTSAMIDTIVQLMADGKISEDLVVALTMQVSAVSAQLLNQRYEPLAAVLQNVLREFRTHVDNRDRAQIQQSLDTMMVFASGLWRDEYVNPELARKIAAGAAASRQTSFLVSVGDAHLLHNPVQIALNRLRSSTGFSHRILFNKSKAAQIPGV